MARRVSKAAPLIMNIYAWGVRLRLSQARTSEEFERVATDWHNLPEPHRMNPTHAVLRAAELIEDGRATLQRVMRLPPARSTRARA